MNESRDLPWIDAERAEALHVAAAERILVFDGAMGTALQDRDLCPDDFGGAALEGCNENLVVTRPDVYALSSNGSRRAVRMSMPSRTRTFCGRLV